MEPLAVVIGFDPDKNAASGVVSSLVFPAVNQFVLEGPPERFHGRIVIAVTFPAHAGFHTKGLQSLAIIAAGILHSAV